MKIITHISMFEDTQNENLGDLERLQKVFDNLPDKKIIQNYINHDSEESLLADLKKISPRRVALELIKEMCFLAHSDDVLSDRETLFIGNSGQAMGIELDKIEQISNWVIDRIIWLEQARLIFEDVK